MTKYRKKPVEVTAWQWRGWKTHDLKHWPMLKRVPAVKALAMGLSLGVRSVGLPPGMCAWLETADGGQLVVPGNYIVQDENGSFSVCASRDFHEKYEKIKEGVG